MSVRKSSHGTIFLIVSSGSPRALIASSLRSTSKKTFCPMTRSLHPPMTAHGHRVRFVATWREEFFEVPVSLRLVVAPAWPMEPVGASAAGHAANVPIFQKANSIPLLHPPYFDAQRKLATSLYPP